MSEKRFPNRASVNNFLKGLWRDALPSLSPEGSYNEAWNAVKQSDKESFYGVSNEPSNELKVALPGEVRGLYYVEERDQYVVFLLNDTTNKGEVGIIDEKKCSYSKYCDEESLEITQIEWVDVTAKVLQPCNQLYIYFSTKNTYKYLNLDDPCGDFCPKLLFECQCIPALKTQIIEGAGRLPNGIYQFAARMRDADGNRTNWFKISNPVSIAGGGFIEGERSKQAINITLSGLSKDFQVAELAVISTIGGVTVTEEFDEIGFSEGDIDYLYRGKTGREQTMDIAEILARGHRYIRGKNLQQYDGRLILYNTQPVTNLNYQRQANDIEAKYQTWVVPAREAGKYKGLLRNEKYMFAIRWNFCDGTSSADFHIPGRESFSGEEVIVDGSCTNCRIPYWRKYDTSKQEQVFLDEIYDLTTESGSDENAGIDFSDLPDYSEDVLTEDESSTVIFEEDDLPSEEEITQEINQAQNDFNTQLDCLCEAAQELAGEVDPTGFLGQIADLIGLIDNATSENIAEILDIIENIGDYTLETFEEAISNIPIVGGIGSDILDGLGDLLFGEDDNGCDKCKDIGGHLALAQVLCMCVVRSVDDSPEGTPGTDDQGGLTDDTISTLQAAAEDVVSGYTTTTAEGRTLVRQLDYYRKRVGVQMEELKTSVRALNKVSGELNYTRKGGECSKEGVRRCVGSSCYECRGGHWTHVDNGDRYSQRPTPSTKKFNRTPECRGKLPKANNFNFFFTTEESGCERTGIQPKLYSEGVFGYWETESEYPLTEDCECQPIYGDLAGANVRLHRVPSATKEPHFLSLSSGVPNVYDTTNREDKDSYVFFISPKFENITPPKDLPKPLCPDNPFSITYVVRTESNKSVLGSGLAISCFQGQVQNEQFAFPKHAVNSFERYDRTIDPSGASMFRGGRAITDARPYFIHSPDFHLHRPPLDADTVLFELEYYGKGFRHALYANGEDTGSAFVPKVNQKGAQQSINLNHYRVPQGADLERGPNVQCVQAMSYAPADSVIAKNDEFTYPLSNLWRESGVYTELEGEGPIPFVQGDGPMAGLYGGEQGAPGDNASDRSFTGDTLIHEMPIHDARGHYVTFTRWVPRQYGSVITQVYEPLGLEATATDLATGSIEGWAGDSFVGPMSVRRTGFVSDKSNRKISTFLSDAGITGDQGGAVARFFVRFFGRILKAMFRVIGIKNGGYVPESGDVGDYINIFGGLRFIADELPTDISELGPAVGELSPANVILRPSVNNPTDVGEVSDVNRGDNYFPHLVKTNIFSWFSGNTNFNYRQVGDAKSGAVYYPRLKEFNLSTKLPENSPWEDAYLARFYSILEENSKWKLIVQAVILFLFTYMIGIMIILKGISGIVDGSQAIAGGTYALQTIGGVIAALVGVALVFIGIYWIVYWAGSDADNKLVENLLGIKNTRPDRKNRDGSYSIDEGKLRQFEDNYWEYNPDYHLTNRFELGFGMGDPYPTCICPTEYNNKIYYSNKQKLDSNIDAWQNYKVNNFLDIPSDMGSIQRLVLLGDNLFAHTTDMLISLRSGQRSLQLDQGSILLGSGNLFQTPAPLFGGVTEGYAGLLDPNSAITTQWGYIFPDREARKLFMFDASQVVPISDAGVQGFFQENFNLKLLEQFPDYPYVDNKTELSVGYSIGVDHQHGRVLFTKRDYEAYNPDELVLSPSGPIFTRSGLPTGTPEFNSPRDITVLATDYFCNKSFTLSYDPVNKTWISFHSYLPNLYGWNRFDMYSFNRVGMWRHNSDKSFLNFYGQAEDFVVEFTIRDAETRNPITLDSILIDGEAHVKLEGRYIQNPKITFDDIIVYNSYQNTGRNQIIDHDEQDIIQRSSEVVEQVRAEFKMRRWSINEFIDILKDYNEHQFEAPCEIALPPLASNNLLDSPREEALGTLHDTFARVRLIFKSREDVKLYLKEVRARFKNED